MVHEYSLKVFGNELFDTLAFIKEHQHKIGTDWYCKMSQQEIADSLHISKLKANRYIGQLKEYGFLKYYGDKRGFYELTETGEDAYRRMIKNN